MMIRSDRGRETIDATRLRALRQCLEVRQVAVQHQSPDLDYILSENAPEGWPTPESAGDQRVADRMRLLANAVLEGSTSASSEIETIEHGVRQVHEVTCIPDRGPDGRLRGIMTVVADVTQSHDREMAIASLLREVSHRSKNLLAIVLSIAAQTANHTRGTEDFLQKFRGRIQALASTQDFVTESNWLGTPFQALVLAQLGKHAPLRGNGIDLTGDNPILGPNAALHVGLAIHELVTNAVLYGALSAGSSGHIDIGAALEYSPDDEPRLVIDWREVHHSTHAQPVPRFGSVVLRQVVPRSLGGLAKYDVAGDSVRYRLTVPGDQFTV